MKLVYNTERQIIEEGITYFWNINPYKDIRIELDTYELQESESLLTNLERILVFHTISNDFDYNDLRKYLLTNVVPLWNELSDLDKNTLKSYSCVPADFVWDFAEEANANETLVKQATACRQRRIDKGRTYINLHFKSNPTLGAALYQDTKQMMIDFVTAKYPTLYTFINSVEFDAKPYYSVELKNQLNYILFR